MGARVIELAPDDYSYEMLRRTMQSEEEGSWAKYGAYAAAWKYTLLVRVMKELCKGMCARRTRRSRPSASTCATHHHQPEMGTLWALTSYLKRLEGFKIGKYEAQVKAKELERLYRLDEIGYLIPHLQRALEDQRIVVIVDELDKGWDSSGGRAGVHRGAVPGVRLLEPPFPNLRSYMSLRQELYDNTPSLYEDAQKYRDLIETISWTEEDLRSLIARRLRYAVPRLADASDTRCWRTLFASTHGGGDGRLLPLHRRQDAAPSTGDDSLLRAVPALRRRAQPRAADGQGRHRCRRAGVLARPGPRRGGRATLLLSRPAERVRGVPRHAGHDGARRPRVRRTRGGLGRGRGR